MSIPLPPLPEPVTLYHSPSFLAGEYIYITGHTPDQLRARDQEIVRVVLEAAIARVKSRFDHEAAATAHHAGTWFEASQYHADRLIAASKMLDILRALEFKHE